MNPVHYGAGLTSHSLISMGNQPPLRHPMGNQLTHQHRMGNPPPQQYPMVINPQQQNPMRNQPPHNNVYSHQSWNNVPCREMNIEAHFKIKIHERNHHGRMFPPTWENLQGQPWAVFPVNSNSTEYYDVLRKFQSGNPFIRNVAKLERIQNVALYKQFLAQEEKVKNKMARAGVWNPVTCELFHGTSTDVCANIYKNGFDRSHAGKNGTAYGKGVYFAVHSSYSHGYTSPGINGYRAMFLTKVITGEYCQGDSSMITAPTKPGGFENDLYDSVVNDISNPGMFVVFKDASVYPDYVLTYS